MQIRWAGLALVIGVFLGFVSLQHDTGANQPLPNEMTVIEIDAVKPILEASDFATFWRNVHDPLVTPSDEISAESGSTTNEGTWRLVGVVAIGREETAYLFTSDGELVAVREGEEFGGNYLLTEINKKSVSYKNPEHENRVLSLYGTATEVEL